MAKESREKNEKKREKSLKCFEKMVWNMLTRKTSLRKREKFVPIHALERNVSINVATAGLKMLDCLCFHIFGHKDIKGNEIGSFHMFLKTRSVGKKILRLILGAHSHSDFFWNAQLERCRFANSFSCALWILGKH